MELAGIMFIPASFIFISIFISIFMSIRFSCNDEFLLYQKTIVSPRLSIVVLIPISVIS